MVRLRLVEGKRDLRAIPAPRWVEALDPERLGLAGHEVDHDELTVDREDHPPAIW